MSKILNIRLPASATTTDFKPQDFNQLKEAIQQIVLQLNTTYTPVASENTLGAMLWMQQGGGSGGPVRSFQNSVGELRPYAMFMDNNDQTNAGATVENLIEFGTVDFGSSVRVEDGTDLYFDYAGVYLVTVSCQVTNADNEVHQFDLWLKKSGEDYPESNTRFDVPQRKNSNVLGHTVANMSFIFTVTDPTEDYFQMAWWSDSTDVMIEHYDASTNPTRPEIPSVILTAVFLSAENNSGQ